ncbi:MBL fold metallo-hydrolase [Modestobacter roseus]|uniref:Glyoxylase-like metal-dependent hydrolase (Beta-lactamase superfamily II) n=1 Tax=Modestobacter roseus TaxID=1181884 RepID=A0A562IVJ5_9ACTN|nr:MBL fold metallo-hydrolase [Modestobacter roseus]MQA32991.1 MBL fold metallo-hydrolase [Modestobacter roseus]TWH74554.1 glyoxylase-like metal-dependent hydrolase (beta-lactamase superfamily II) [Modestobacter roseus]
MELAPGLHRIGNDLVAAHLVVTDEGITAIDAGLPGHWRDLVRELTAIGREPADIRGVVLTHGDSDHIGFAERLRRDHGVPVFVHAADAARARGEESSKPAWGGTRLGPLARFLAYSARKGGLRTTHVEQVVEVADGQVLDLPGAPEVLNLPGHSPGSIAVHVPEVSALFVGDALTTGHVLTGRQGPQPAPFTDDQATAAASLARLEPLQVDWVLPGHGAPWRGGVPQLLAAYRAAAG